MLQNRDNPRVRRFAEDFYERVCSSGRFSWLGLVETEDQRGNACWVIYLQERRHEGSERPKGGGALGPIFADLAVALRPKVFLDLYYLPEAGGAPGKRAEKAACRRYGTKTYRPTVSLLWGERVPCEPADG